MASPRAHRAAAATPHIPRGSRKRRPPRTGAGRGVPEGSRAVRLEVGRPAVLAAIDRGYPARVGAEDLEKYLGLAVSVPVELFVDTGRGLAAVGDGPVPDVVEGVVLRAAGTQNHHAVGVGRAGLADVE